MKMVFIIWGLASALGTLNLVGCSSVQTESIAARENPLKVSNGTAENETAERNPASDEFDPNVVAVAKDIGDIFKGIMVDRHGNTGAGVKRAVFLKPHGCARAQFSIAKDLPKDYRVGLFSDAYWKDRTSRDAWVRVSSDNVPTSPDAENNTIGFAIKVLDVPGEKVLPGETEFNTQDFLTQNVPQFFVDTAQDFLEITKAFGDPNPEVLKNYLADHEASKKILDAMA